MESEAIIPVKKFNSSPVAEGPAAFHDTLQFFENRSQLRFGLRRALTVESLQPNRSHFRLQFLTENRAVGSALRSAIVTGLHFVSRFLEPPQRVVHRATAFFL